MHANNVYPLGGSVKCSNGILRLLSAPTLLFALVVASMFGFAGLDTRWHTVAIIAVIYLIFFFFVYHNAFYIICKARRRLQLLESEIEAYLDQHQWEFDGQTRAVGSVDHFFDAFEKKLRNNHFSSVAAGVFPTLGILGTFISIAISMPDFSVETSKALESEISILLGGVGTAFYASIYGIFLSLWWLFFEKIGLSRYDEMLGKLYNKTQEKLWSEEALRLMEYRRQGALQADMRLLAESFSGEGTLLQSSLHNLKEEYDALAETIRGANGVLDDRLRGYVATLQSLNEALHSQLGGMQRASQSMAETGSFMETERVLMQQIGESNKLFTATQEALAERFESLMETAQHRHNLHESELRTSREQLGTINETLAAFVGELSNLKSFGELLKEQSDAMARHHENVLRELGTGTERFDEGLADRMRTSFGLIDKEVAGVIEKLGGAASVIYDNGTRIEGLLEAHAKKVESILKGTH